MSSRPGTAGAGPERLGSADPLDLRVPLAPGGREGDHHDHHAQEDPRHVPRHEQRRDRHPAGDGRVDDRGRRRRDEQPGRGRGDVDRGAESRVVAGLLLPLVQRAADRRGRRHGRTGQRAEQHVGQHVGVRQRAGDPAHRHQGEVDEPARDAAGVHEVAREDEQRHGQQREALDADVHLLPDDVGGVVPRQERQRGGERGDPERHRDRHAREQQHEERAEQDGDRGQRTHQSVPSVSIATSVTRSSQTFSSCATVIARPATGPIA